MEPRIIAEKAAPGAYRALLGVHSYLESSGLDHALLHLVYLRASQLNGCAYCTDMHWKDARAAGHSEQKLSLLPVWREMEFFSPRERAALEWTESVTLIAGRAVPDPVYRAARELFSEAELVNLTLAIGAINAWNRLAIAFHKPAGSYQPRIPAHQAATA